MTDLPEIRPCDNATYCGNWISADADAVAMRPSDLGARLVHLCPDCTRKLNLPRIETKVIEAPVKRGPGRPRKVRY